MVWEDQRRKASQEEVWDHQQEVEEVGEEVHLKEEEEEGRLWEDQIGKGEELALSKKVVMVGLLLLEEVEVV